MRTFLFAFVITVFSVWMSIMASRSLSSVVWPILFSMAISVWVIISYKRGRKKIETSMQKITSSLGLSYRRRGKVRLWEKEDLSNGAPFWRFYSSLERLSKVPEDILSGIYKGHEVMACYLPNRSVIVLRGSTCFKLKHQRGYPQVVVCDKRKMGLRGPKKLTGYVRFGQNPLAQKFPEAFCVFSPNESFARDICNGNMMTYLLALRDELGRNFEMIAILGQSITLQEEGYHVDKAERRLNQLMEVYNLLPQTS